MSGRLSLLLALSACKGAPDSAAPADPDADTGAECPAPEGAPALDAWGGDARVELGATGFFSLASPCGRWTFVSPEGHPLLSVGVNALNPTGEPGRETGVDPYGEATSALYPDREAWAEVAGERLRSWGFNTAGSWSDAGLMAGRLAVAPNLGLSGNDWETGEVSDFYDPDWEQSVVEKVEARVGPWVGAAAVLGWFLDNELRWGPDWRGTDTLLQRYLALPPDAPGKIAAVALILDEAGEAGLAAVLGEALDRDALLEKQSGWGALNRGASDEADALTTAFLEQTADRYFSFTAAAIRAVDPDHLILGGREVSVLTRAEVYAAAAPWVDVLSVNTYVYTDGWGEVALGVSGGLDPADQHAALFALTGKPVLVSEFGFRAADSGLPNSWPPIYPILDTQEDRAEAFAEVAQAWRQTDWIVGYHWFDWVDQPPDGRFDGEDNNWGLVNAADEPYAALVAEMTAVNALD